MCKGRALFGSESCTFTLQPIMTVVVLESYLLTMNLQLLHWLAELALVDKVDNCNDTSRNTSLYKVYNV